MRYFPCIPIGRKEPTTIYKFFDEKGKSPERYSDSGWVEDDSLFLLFMSGELIDEDEISAQEARKIIRRLNKINGTYTSTVKDIWHSFSNWLPMSYSGRQCMASYRIKSLVWFVIIGGVTASILVYIALGFGVSIAYTIIGSAIFFSGFWGYVLGNHFGTFANNNSKYKAMLLGALISTLIVVTSVIFSILAVATIHGAIGEAKSNSDVVLFAGIVFLVAIPMTIPIGAMLGYVIHKSSDDG